MGDEAEEIKVVASGLVPTDGLTLGSRLEFHRRQACWACEPASDTGGDRPGFFGNDGELFGCIEGPTVSQDEYPVFLGIGQLLGQDVGCGNVPDGGVFSFGDAGFYGSEGGTTLNKPIVAIAG